MEFNGFRIDQNLLIQNKNLLEQQLSQIQQKLNETIEVIWPPCIPFNSASNDDLSILFFGGNKYISKKEEIGTFKTGLKIGQIKYRNIETAQSIKGLNITPLKEWYTKKQGVYSTSEAVLKQINHPVAKYILTIRELSKQINTYYTATEEFIYDWDG